MVEMPFEEQQLRFLTRGYCVTSLLAQMMAHVSGGKSRTRTEAKPGQAPYTLRQGARPCFIPRVPSPEQAEKLILRSKRHRRSLQAIRPAYSLVRIYYVNRD